MNFNRSSKQTLMSIGMGSLVIGFVAQRFLPTVVNIGSGWADGLFGLFLGISIGANLLAVRSKSCGRGEQQKA